MHLTSLAVSGLRNLEPLRLTLDDARYIVIHGRNAQGKTNLLEVVYSLATLKGLRAARLKELIRWGDEAGEVAGVIHTDGIQRNLSLSVSATGRTVQLDGKNITQLSDYFAHIRAVAFTPQDGGIVSEEPARRRAWLDRAAFTASPLHLDVVRTYRRCLQQKSAALKQSRPDGAMLDALDDRLAQEGARLAQRRSDLLAELSPHIRQLHSRIAGGHADLSLDYRTQAPGSQPSERYVALRERLASVRSDELRRRITLAGVQKDDVRIRLDGRSARTFGSRGQVRSVVLALKLAELVAARERGDVPLFLLDDLSSELDRRRTASLVAVLEDLGAQVWVTTTDPDHIQDLPEAATRRLHIDGGRLT